MSSMNTPLCCTESSLAYDNDNSTVLPAKADRSTCHCSGSVPPPVAADQLPVVPVEVQVPSPLSV